MAVVTGEEVLSSRALNRATLARQSLLRRSAVSPEAMIEQLVGMQAQAPFPPYYGLWTRLRGFHPDQLSTLLLRRRVVRIVLMRGTVHLVTAADCLALRPPLQPTLQRQLHGNAGYRTALTGLDLPEIADAARELLDQRPRTLAELGPLLARRWPGRDPGALGQVARTLLPLVQLPPRAIWGRSGQPVCATAQSWLDRPLDTTPDERARERIVRRYLGAFGPATIRDAQSWSGLTRLREVFQRLRPELVTFRDEHGAELFDLPGAPRPPAAAPAPPRLLPEFDNLLLGYADRTRFLTEEHRRRVFSVNGIIAATVLVGGRVRGTWKVEGSGLRITLFEPVARTEEDGLRREGLRLLTFAAPEAADPEVRFSLQA